MGFKIQNLDFIGFIADEIDGEVGLQAARQPNWCKNGGCINR